jgi:hypothetical protein
VAAIKLDMSKAYNQIKWGFLQQMMARLGFERSWIDLIIRCVSSVNYRIKVNVEYKEMIIPQRGLRQGDPLSPIFLSYAQKGCLACSKRQTWMEGCVG